MDMCSKTTVYMGFTTTCMAACKANDALEINKRNLRIFNCIKTKCDSQRASLVSYRVMVNPYSKRTEHVQHLAA